MPNRDQNDEYGYPQANPDPPMSENIYDFDALFENVDLSEFEFEVAPAAPAMGPSAPKPEKKEGSSRNFLSDPDPSEPFGAAEDSFPDSGAYRSYDGSSEYRSFDAAMPDAPEDGWYYYSDEDSQLDEEYDASYDDPCEGEESAEETRHRGLSIFAHIMLTFIALLSAFYLMVLYSGIPALTNLRDLYVRTAMSTLNHKWLATAIVPSNIIDELMLAQYKSEDDAVGIESNPDWGYQVQGLPSLSAQNPLEQSSSEENLTEPVNESLYGSEEEQLFFEYFHELDVKSAQEYFEDHPGVLENGYAYVDINEAGLNDGGTSIKTNQGDEVLAINAQEGILLIRIWLDGSVLGTSRGVLAICKDTSKLRLCSATTLPACGQTVETICKNNNGILAMTGSAFLDPNGLGSGGELSGLAVCSGKILGERLGYGYKRLELRDDDCMYIVDSNSSVASNTRDAVEMQPALIVDGQIVVDSNTLYNADAPRVALGQTSKMETMMLVLEGRFNKLTDNPMSPGCSVLYVAEKLAEYDCYQALNLDGGTSAMMYYDGENVVRCSNTAIINVGRAMPTVWVYG